MSPGRRPSHGTRSNATSSSPTTAITSPRATSARPSSDMGVASTADALLEERALTDGGGRRLLAEMGVGLSRHPASIRRADQKGDLEEIGLHQLGQRLGIVVDRGGHRLQAGGAAVVQLDDGGAEAAVEAIETARVDTTAHTRVTTDGG